MNKRIVVLGGDGFCGFPTALYLSKHGYDVTIIDNLSRRKIDIELGIESLTPIKPIEDRLDKWYEISRKRIPFFNLDVSLNYHRILDLIYKIKPLAIIHFAEQRAAPYSMKSPYHKRYTVDNNLNATHNILNAITESELDIHLIHLGSTGVYGYSDVGMKIPEGYLPIKVDVDGKEKKLEIMYPANPGSIYHLTKCQDALFFYYYNKNDGIKITDLHQGIVYGTQTDETMLHENLVNRYDYDGDYGTVLNRFVMQSVIGHPLTIHGTGGQTRAFIHIKDTVKCIRMAIENPPKKGEKVKIFNQTAECLNIKQLALKIQKITNCEIKYFNNPRNEDPRNDLEFNTTGFLNLGWEPIFLDEGLISEITNVAKRYNYRCDKSKIICTSVWNKHINIDYDGSEEILL